MSKYQHGVIQQNHPNPSKLVHMLGISGSGKTTNTKRKKKNKAAKKSRRKNRG